MKPTNWHKLSLIEQLGNIGSEILRCLKWQTRNSAYSEIANTRALELIDLTLNQKLTASEYKELCRMRELWLDFYLGVNQYHQLSRQWEKYFLSYNYLAQKTRP
jgi:hypothetical protein